MQIGVYPSVIDYLQTIRSGDSAVKRAALFELNFGSIPSKLQSNYLSRWVVITSTRWTRSNSTVVGYSCVVSGTLNRNTGAAAIKTSTNISSVLNCTIVSLSTYTNCSAGGRTCLYI